MSEIRHDPLLPRWVIIAENRAGRPNEFAAPRDQRQAGPCPFCPGNEAQTPAALLVRRPADRSGDDSQWRIRVVANRYPALELAGAGEPFKLRELAERRDLAQRVDLSERCDGLFRREEGFGVHEVVIDSAEHVSSITETSDDAAVELFDVYRERVEAIGRTESVASALVFKNVGAAAGASIEHAHSQIVAAARMPPEVSAQWLAAGEFFEREGVCPFCRMIDEELADGSRIVEAGDEAVALCPFASRFAYETWIFPRRHESHFERGAAATLAAAARMTRRAVARIEAVLGRPAYNVVIHSAPFGEAGGLGGAGGEAAHCHWHVELYPRIASPAGSELGGGCYINPVSPERAAQRLRAAVR